MSKDVPEMVERVARALYEKSGANTRYDIYSGKSIPATWNEQDELFRQMWRSRAGTAIEAMREPTEAMADKGENVLVCGPFPADLRDSPSKSWATAKSCWRNMITAALISPTGSEG